MVTSLLRDVFGVVKGFDSNIHLHSFIYLAQELEILPKEYEFDYNWNIPFSEKLEEDFLVLKSEKYVVEVSNGKRLQVAGGLNDKESLSIDQHQAEKLDEIISIDSDELVNIARLIYLIKNNPDLVEKGNKDKLIHKARRAFLMSLSTFEESFSRLNDIKAILS